MSQVSTRRIRVQVSITDDRGHTKHYWCAPVKPADRGPGVLRSFKLTQRICMPDEDSCGRMKWVNSEKPYFVKLLDTGSIACTCPGFESHRHCKHVESLPAAGFFDQDLVLECQKRHLALNMREEDLERMLTAARKAHDDAAEIILAEKQRKIAEEDAAAQKLALEQELQRQQAMKAKKPRKPRTRKQLVEAQ